MLSGDALRRLRIIKNISTTEMAAGIGKSDRWVRKIEACEETPTEEVYRDWLNIVYGKKRIPAKARAGDDS